MEKPGISSIPELSRPRVRAHCRPLLWMAAWMCGTFLMSLGAADVAKQKGAKAPPPIAETQKKSPSPQESTINALADADEREKVETVRMKALKGDADAQVEMAVRCQKGSGVELDPEAAAMWLRKSAEGGYVSAQSILSYWYTEGICVKQDWEQAFHWALKAATGGSKKDMYNVGWFYMTGKGVPVEPEKMLFWFGKAADAGFLRAQRELGLYCLRGEHGVGVDQQASCKWFAMGAEQDDPVCLHALAVAYCRGEGVPMNQPFAVRLWQRAAEQGLPEAQFRLGGCYVAGIGIVLDLEEAYFWLKLAAKQGDKDAIDALHGLDRYMTKEELDSAKAKVAEFKPRPPRPMMAKADPGDTPKRGAPKKDEEGIATGTGFFIADSGYLVTNYHVVKGATDIQVQIAKNESVRATVVAEDKKADIAILKIKDGIYLCLPIIPSDEVKLGASVATVGFPNPGVQGFAPKLAKGEIASLAGLQDDPDQFQISVPLQPGNSGGCLVNAKGNVVGVVCAIMDQEVALATTGTLANNVAYAVKSSLVLDLAKSVPGLVDQLRSPKTKARDFEDVVSDAQDATVLVVVKFKE